LAGDELLGNLILLLVAGFETTTNLLGNGLTVLLGHPDAAARLREDADLAPVEELLRFDSPVQLTSRWSRQSTSLSGERIDPFSGILVLLGAGNRDPDRFAHPNVFDPSRDGGELLGQHVRFRPTAVRHGCVVGGELHDCHEMARVIVVLGLLESDEAEVRHLLGDGLAHGLVDLVSAVRFVVDQLDEGHVEILPRANKPIYPKSNITDSTFALTGRDWRGP
jgi:hypothetical protein